MSEPHPRSSAIPADIAELVARIVELRAGERESALAQLRQRDAVLAERVTSLLAVEGAVGLRSTQGQPSAQVDPTGIEPASELVRERLAGLAARSKGRDERLKVAEEVARGGMGAIYRARDTDLGRELAMKVMLPPVDGADPPQTVAAQVLHRFLDEAQITGQLDHPGVVPVHEVGIDACGRAYFTMRLVKGKTADVVFRLARERKDDWTQTRALEVILKVCDTLAFSHSKGVVHRDIKPTNVMVGRFGEVYVMDWGLAKVLGADDRRDLRLKPASTPSDSRVRTDRSKDAESDPDSPLLTMDGAVVGTPSYMAPEQAEGRIEQLGVQSDVYSVGAMLYALLAGTAPYVKPGQRASPYSVLRWVIEGPPRPVHEMDPTAPAELVSICEKAMARTTEQRYADTKELADDLRAFPENRVVRAHRTGAWAELKLFLRRNRLVLPGTLALVAAVSISGLVWSRRVEEKAKLARSHAATAAANQALAEQREREARDNLALARTRESEALAAAKEAHDQREEARQQSYIANVAAAMGAYEREEPARLRRFLDQAAAGMRGFEWRHLVAIADTSLLAQRVGLDASLTLQLPQNDVSRALLRELNRMRVFDLSRDGELLLVAFPGPGDLSADGRRFACAPTLGTLRVFDTDGERELANLRGHRGRVSAVAFVGDDRRLVSAGDDSVKIWDIEARRTTAVLRGHAGKVLAVDASRDGRHIVTAAADCTACLWSADAGDLRAVLRHSTAVVSARFSPDGSRVLTQTETGELHVWSVATGAALASVGDAELARYADARLSGDGKRLFAASHRGTLQVFDVDTGRELACLHGHRAGLCRVAVSPDGSQVASADERGNLRIWETTSFAMVAVLRGHSADITDVTFSRDGGRVAAVSAIEGVARLWDVAAACRSLLSVPGGCVRLLFAADGERLFALTGDGFRILDVATHAEHAFVSAGPVEGGQGNASGAVVHGTLAPDGTRLVTVATDRVVLWDTSTLEPLATRAGSFTGAVFSPQAERIALLSPGRIELCDATSLTPQAVIPAAYAYSATFAPDGAKLVVNSLGLIHVWDCRTGEFGAEQAVGMWRSNLVWVPGGARFVGGTTDGALQTWDMATNEVITSPNGDSAALYVAVSPDGLRIATCMSDMTVRLFEAQSLREIMALGTLQRFPRQLAFTPDGSCLFALDGEEVRAWDTVPTAARAASSAEIQAARAAAQRLVDTLLQVEPDPVRAGAHLALRADLRPPVARAARGLLLGRVAAERSEAVRHVRLLLARLIVGADVVEAVMAEGTLTAERRERALRSARTIADDSQDLDRRARHVAIRSDRSREDYLGALRAASRAAAQSTDDGNVVVTLGIALYRNGRYLEAKSELLRAGELCRRAGGARIAIGEAFLAMACAALGEMPEARRTLSALEEDASREEPQQEPYRTVLLEARARVLGN